ncbi:hypothetical protein LTR86_009976 [Recurvomyces mirabilis]|nr:hypothetical protein LTR86_009976 [Recurvomyces mirabilis]
MHCIFGRGASLRWAIYAACLSAFLFFGYDQGVLSGLLANPHFQDQFGNPNDVITGITVSSYCLGAFFGCLTNFAIGDILGRRKMIWLAMGFIIVGATLQTSAFSLAHLIVGRVITGLGTGIDSSTVPMYQSELSEKEWRGRLVSWEILFIGLGITLAYWIDYGLSYVDSAVSWRFPIGFQLTFAIAVVFVIWGCPESPRWLAKKGRTDEAIDVLCRVYDLPPDDEYVQSEIRSIQQVIALESHESAQSWTSIFKNDALKTRRRVILAWFGLFFNQLSGINLVVYYLPTVLESNVGVERTTALLIAGFIQLMFPIGNLVPALALDKIGRRWTMFCGCAALSVCMMMIAALLSNGSSAASSASIAFFFLYMLIFGGTVNVVPWVYGPEILPLHARTRGTSISVSSHWIWNFFIVMISPVLINRIQWRTYLIFMALLAAFCPAVYFFCPETAGLSLEDIDIIFLPKEQGGLDGNARVRLTPSDANQRRMASNDKAEVRHEKVQDAV